MFVFAKNQSAANLPLLRFDFHASLYKPALAKRLDARVAKRRRNAGFQRAHTFLYYWNTRIHLFIW
jgi:hypothetical protein